MCTGKRRWRTVFGEAGLRPPFQILALPVCNKQTAPTCGRPHLQSIRRLLVCTSNPPPPTPRNPPLYPLPVSPPVHPPYTPPWSPMSRCRKLPGTLFATIGKFGKNGLKWGQSGQFVGVLWKNEDNSTREAQKHFFWCMFGGGVYQARCRWKNGGNQGKVGEYVSGWLH